MSLMIISSDKLRDSSECLREEEFVGPNNNSTEIGINQNDYLMSTSLFWEEEMATHSSIIACRIPWTEEPGGLLSIRSHRVGHDWSDLACILAMEREMATHSGFLAWRVPGTEEPGGLLSMGLHRLVHDWSDLAAAAKAAHCFGNISFYNHKRKGSLSQLSYFQLIKHYNLHMSPLTSSYIGFGCFIIKSLHTIMLPLQSWVCIHSFTHSTKNFILITKIRKVLIPQRFTYKVLPSVNL